VGLLGIVSDHPYKLLRGGIPNRQLNKLGDLLGVVFSYLQKLLLEVVKNHPKKWDFWAQFVSVSKLMVKGLTINNHTI
jgi:hypothetical protein